MHRDMDLIRRIVLATSELPYGQTLSSLCEVTNEDFYMHVTWMCEAKLIAGIVGVDLSNEPYAFVERLTWEGCEFADSVRNETLWNRAKENVLRPTMSFSFGVLRAWLKAEILQGLPSLRTHH